VVEVGPAGVEEEGAPHTRERERACIVCEREGALYAEWRVYAFMRDREGGGDISQ
jgi:hypothetical protein